MKSSEKHRCCFVQLKPNKKLSGTKGWEVGKEKEKMMSISAEIVRERIKAGKQPPKHFLQGDWKPRGSAGLN